MNIHRTKEIKIYRVDKYNVLLFWDRHDIYLTRWFILLSNIQFLRFCCICVGKAMEEGSKWYFYSRRTQTRITRSGVWKSIGEDEPILSSESGSSKRKVIGIKKYYVFYIGEPNSEGIKTNWILQEYSLSDQCGSSSSARRKSKNVIHLSKPTRY